MGRGRNRTHFRARARARGPVRLLTPELDLAWTMTLDTEPPSSGAMAPGQLRADGSARGVLPPAIEANVDGTLALAAAVGSQPVAVEGRVRARGDRMKAEVRLTGLGGTADASAETSGTRLQSLELTGRGIELGRAVPHARGDAEVRLHAWGP